MKQLPIVSRERSCDGCTKCCEGYVSAVVFGERIQPGRPCRFTGPTGCTVYEQRQEDPCKTFKCLWLANDTLPEWMKPDLIDAIFTQRLTDKGEPFWAIAEAGAKLDSSVLAWVVEELVRRQGQLNVMYQVGGGWRYLGSESFLAYMEAREKTL